jgi:hypothetical protein
VKVALEKVASAVAEATAVVANLNAAVSQDQQQSETRVAETARRRDTKSVSSSVVDLEPDLAFADWRSEVLSFLEAS